MNEPNREQVLFILGEVPAKEKYFYLASGGHARSLEDLVLLLDHVTEEEFKKHVNPHKNDFSNWIRHVIRDEYLADQIAMVKTRFEVQYYIEKRVNHLRSILARTETKEKVEKKAEAEKEQYIHEKDPVHIHKTEEVKKVVDAGFDYIIFILGTLFGLILMLVIMAVLL